VFDLKTRAVIKRRIVTKIPIPMPPNVIAAVECYAAADNIDKLVIRLKHNIILYDSSSTAGVDYTSETYQDPIYNSDRPDYEPSDDESQDE
jgi:hypothetical protein